MRRSELFRVKGYQRKTSSPFYPTSWGIFLTTCIGPVLWGGKSWVLPLWTRPPKLYRPRSRVMRQWRSSLNTLSNATLPSRPYLSTFSSQPRFWNLFRRFPKWRNTSRCWALSQTFIMSGWLNSKSDENTEDGYWESLQNSPSLQ